MITVQCHEMNAQSANPHGWPCLSEQAKNTRIDGPISRCRLFLKKLDSQQVIYGASVGNMILASRELSFLNLDERSVAALRAARIEPMAAIRCE